MFYLTPLRGKINLAFSKTSLVFEFNNKNLMQIKFKLEKTHQLAPPPPSPPLKKKLTTESIRISQKTFKWLLPTHAYTFFCINPF